MVTKIFYYCLYNSYDFLIAGYSFDLCLCDLNKVSNIKTPLSKLSEALIAGLKNPRVQENILLAHWKAQSFWQENFTDLYDFCFSLEKRLNPNPQNPPAELADIIQACNEVKGALEKGVIDNDDRLIVRAEFAGPEYQYSRGMSVFFPWSIPTDINFWNQADGRRGEYQRYNFVEGFGSKPTWNDFLSEYFEITRRATHRAEVMETGEPETEVPDSSTPRARKLILQRDLLEEFATSVFNESGQLSGDNKGGGNSSTGDGDCDCPSIKNYPSFLREETVPLSQTFLDDPTVLDEGAFLSELE
jgi:hypothetical protein